MRGYRTKRWCLNSDLSVAPIDGSPGLLVVRAVFFYPFSERVCLRVRSRLLLLSYYGMPVDSCASRIVLPHILTPFSPSSIILAWVMTCFKQYTLRHVHGTRAYTGSCAHSLRARVRCTMFFFTTFSCAVLVHCYVVDPRGGSELHCLIVVNHMCLFPPGTLVHSQMHRSTSVSAF